MREWISRLIDWVRRPVLERELDQILSLDLPRLASSAIVIHRGMIASLG